MIIDYVGVKEINGSLIVMDGVKGVSNEEIVDIRLDNGTMRQGRVVQIEGERIVVQVFEGTRRISLKNTRTRLTGHPMEMPLSPEIIGRVYLTVRANLLTDSEIFSLLKRLISTVLLSTLFPVFILKTTSTQVFQPLIRL